jgi:hypothetical protein
MQPHQFQHGRVFLAMLVVSVFLFNGIQKLGHGAEETAGLYANALIGPEGNQLAGISPERPEVNDRPGRVINFRTVF